MVENFPPICALAGERSSLAKSAMQADRAFAPNRGCFYEVAILADDQQRNEAGQWEIDVFDQLARLKQNCPLLERDFSQVRLKKGKCIGGHRREQAVVPMGLGCKVDQESPPKLLRSSMMERRPREIAKGPPTAVLFGMWRPSGRPRALVSLWGRDREQ